MIKKEMINEKKSKLLGILKNIASDGKSISNKEDALTLIAMTPKGEQRAKILENDEIRSLVLSSGANVTMYSGKVNSEGKNCKDILSDVFIGLIQRKNKKGKLDGLGALGGLAERTNHATFNNLSEKDRKKLLGKKDDIIEKNGKIICISDIDVIRKNNVLREMKEELGDIGITGIKINPDDLELIPMPHVKDDNYMTNIWDGNEECFAISPFCHVYKAEVGLLDDLVKQSKEQQNGEVVEFKKVNLFTALTAYGNKGEDGLALENGRSANKDYRYPHEYLAAWGLASKLLERDETKMIKLAQEVQIFSDHNISFERIAHDTKQSMNDVADVLGVSLKVLQKMENACSNFSLNKLSKSTGRE